MYDSFARLKNINKEMKEQISIFPKLMNLNKFSPSLIGIIFDSTLIDSYNFRGNGYEIEKPQSALSSEETTKSDNQLYSFIFSQPEIDMNFYERHIKNLIVLIKCEFDYKIKYHFDNLLKSSYYLYKISDYYTFIVIFENSKQEIKTKIVSMIQEICNDLIFSNSVYCLFNQNLK